MNARTVAVARESLLQHLRTAVLITIVLTVLLGVIYPLTMTAIAQVILPSQANGSLVRDASGNVVGSAILAQNFMQPQYFHPRLSAAGSDGYDATASGGSNLGPTNQKLIDTVQQRADAYRAENGLAPDASVPVDAVTASASGLDPDITPANALLQVHRVATARGLSDDQVRNMLNQYTEGRTLFVLGEPRVNVLKLNMALDGR
ncbi:MAG: potassium-transporting ATPase subunit KdpC [Chloroflexi bacterium]|nr:potassium-transporting ATPase subunit KdpC [Chloroflexota bacterium]